MPGKIDRLRVLDDLVTPDLWPDIRQRQPSISPEPPTSPTRRLMTALVALAAAVAGSLVVIGAFSGERADRPLSRPSTERIVFSGGDGDAQLDLLSMSADGSDVRQLTDTPASEEEPTVSPDGSRLAFAFANPAIRRRGSSASWMTVARTEERSPELA
jgi:dipeptidyl aminopeptidase/acylaminoacyl peptidase